MAGVKGWNKDVGAKDSEAKLFELAWKAQFEQGDRAQSLKQMCPCLVTLSSAWCVGFQVT